MDAPPPYSEVAPESQRLSFVDGATSPRQSMTPIYEASYEQLFNRQQARTFLPSIPESSSPTFVDFTPLVSETPGQHENFRDLINRANTWILTAPGWDVSSVETFKQWIDNTEPTCSTDKLIFYEKMKKQKSFFYGLRLWIARKTTSGIAQEIDFKNLLPKQVTRRSSKNVPKVRMQNLKELLQDFQTTEESEPIPGKIISIQTLKINVPNIHTFDCNSLLHQEEPMYEYKFINVVRIFYNRQNPSNEQIGAMDFFPLSDIKLFGKDKRESVSQLTSRAFRAIGEELVNSNIRLLNMQTLEVENEKGKNIDTSLLAGREHPNKSEHISFIRATYAKNDNDDQSTSSTSIPWSFVSCKTFLPVVLPDSKSPLKLNVESLEKTKERFEAWLKATGAHVLCSETIYIRSNASQDYLSLEEANGCTPLGEYRWVTAFRFYLAGQYEEPASSMLPTLPKYDEDKCNIS